MKVFLQNEKVQMLIVVPDEIGGLENILENLHQFDEETIEMAANKYYVHLNMPKFKVASDTMNLNSYLQEVTYFLIKKNCSWFSVIII